MGCFSYKCQECGRGVLSSSFSGERVHIFRLKKGEITQQMTGEYDSYGRVFIDGTQDETVSHSLRKSHQWLPEEENDAYPDSLFDITSGYAYIHEDCYKGTPPTFVSVGDPDQGWGADDEEDCYFGNLAPEGHKYRKRKPVEGWNAKDSAYLSAMDRFLDYKCRSGYQLSNMFRGIFNTGKSKLGFVYTLKDIVEFQKENCAVASKYMTDGVARELLREWDTTLRFVYERKWPDCLLEQCNQCLSILVLLHTNGYELPLLEDEFFKAVVKVLNGEEAEITKDMPLTKKYKEICRYGFCLSEQENKQIEDIDEEVREFLSSNIIGENHGDINGSSV